MLATPLKAFKGEPGGAAAASKITEQGWSNRVDADLGLLTVPFCPSASSPAEQ